jgi:hypothetical protein
VALAAVVTVFVVTLKVAVVLPAFAVTDAGTVAEALLLANETDTPPVGAVALKVTVPVEEAPPTTLVGLRTMEDRATVAAGVILSAAVLLTLL